MVAIKKGETWRQRQKRFRLRREQIKSLAADGMILADIARRYRISRERVRQIVREL